MNRKETLEGDITVDPNTYEIVVKKELRIRPRDVPFVIERFKVLGKYISSFHDLKYAERISDKVKEITGEDIDD